MSEKLNNINNTELTAGQMLRQTRTTGRGKREIASISKVLRIREEYLEALENDNYDAIPEVIYVLGFARNYAIELGLDPTVIIDKIKVAINYYQNNEEAALTKDENVNVADEKNDEPAIVKESANLKKNTKLFMVGGLTALGVVLIIGLIFAFIGAESATTNANIIKVNETAEVMAEAPVVDNNDIFNIAINKEYGTENKADAKIILQASSDSWVQVKNKAGDNLFRRSLVAGDVYYVPNGNNISATIGNVGGVDIWVEGNLIPPLGRENVSKSNILMTPQNLYNLTR